MICNLCPRRCGADRLLRTGFCGGGVTPRLARAALHYGEEPCIGGTDGVGAVFFSGCNLRCRFCQNYPISSGNFGADVTVKRLGEIFLELQSQGAKSLDLVTPTHEILSIVEALKLTKSRLNIPVVWNSGGYELPEALKLLSGYISVYFPDLKFYDSTLSEKYAAAPDYFEVAIRAIREMYAQVGECVEQNGVLQKGVLVRHLVLPGCYKDSIQLLRALADALPANNIYLSLLRQYTPCGDCGDSPLSRTLTSYEYNRVCDEAAKLHFGEIFIQEKSSVGEEYIPEFSLMGV